MKAPNITSTARVTLTIEVDLEQPWTSDCRIDYIFKEASRQAVAEVHAKFGPHTRTMRVVGEPKVLAVMTSKE